MNTRRHHRGAVIAIATLSLATITACGSSDNSQNTSGTAGPGMAPTSATMSTPSSPASSRTQTRAATEDGTPTAGSESSPEARARSESASTPSAPPPASTPRRQLPTSAGDYSEAFMQAWTGGDKATMGTYATSAVVDQLARATPQGALLRTSCEGNKCSYSDEDGGRVTLTLDLAKVDSGASQAITGVSVDL